MRRAIIAATVLVVSVGLAQAGIRADLSGDAVVDFATTMDMPFMTVGNPGNADDTHGDGYGGVDYTYNIGKFEVTAGQYTEFLNAVAATDTYGLYSTYMWRDSWGCKIQRSGSSGSYAYSVASDWADRPVNYVRWGDAARFSNWLTNGMPTGAQDLTTTEDGPYFLNGATSEAALQARRSEHSPPGADSVAVLLPPISVTTDLLTEELAERVLLLGSNKRFVLLLGQYLLEFRVHRLPILRMH